MIYVVVAGVKRRLLLFRVWKETPEIVPWDVPSKEPAGHQEEPARCLHWAAGPALDIFAVLSVQPSRLKIPPLLQETRGRTPFIPEAPISAVWATWCLPFGGTWGTQEVPWKHQEAVWCVGDETLAQAAQRGREASSLEISPDHLDVALLRVVLMGQEGPRGALRSLHTSASLGFLHFPGITQLQLCFACCIDTSLSLWLTREVHAHCLGTSLDLFRQGNFWILLRSFSESVLGLLGGSVVLKPLKSITFVTRVIYIFVFIATVDWVDCCCYSSHILSYLNFIPPVATSRLMLHQVLYHRYF